MQVRNHWSHAGAVVHYCVSPAATWQEGSNNQGLRVSAAAEGRALVPWWGAGWVVAIAIHGSKSALEYGPLQAMDWFLVRICPLNGHLLLFVCLFFRFLENKLLNKIISLLHTLWLTNLGSKKESKNQSQENRKFLPIQLVNEFLYVSITLIKHIR